MKITTSNLELMRQSCRLAAKTLSLVGEKIEIGMTTEDINTLVHNFIIENGAYPSPLNYKGFPKSVCTSCNNVACHGIPRKDEKLLDGDIINVDVTTFYPKENGYHGDTSATFYVGAPTKEAKVLVETTRTALNKAIDIVKPGITVGHIGQVIEQHVLANGCKVIKDFVGHGIGKEFHTKPSIFHYGKPGMGATIEEGMVFTIEPIVTLGNGSYNIANDKWTVVSSDNSLTAQFEHTILVTHNGCEVLTKRDKPLMNSEVF